MANNKTTYIEEADIHQCNDCGAYSAEVDKIIHYKTCTPGESERWYEEANDVDS